MPLVADRTVRRLGGNTLVALLVVGASVVLPLGTSPAGAVAGATWVHLLGSSSYDTVGQSYPLQASATDSTGNLFVVGRSDGQLPLSPPSSIGNPSGFVAKYSASGALVWVREFGTAGTTTLANGVAATSKAVYVVGSTDAMLPGMRTPPRGRDGFVAKYSATGNLAWVRTFGGRYYDEANGVSVDSAGDVVVAGDTQGMMGVAAATPRYPAAVLLSYTPGGKRRFLDSYGGGKTRPASATHVAVDCSDTIFVAGLYDGSQVNGIWTESFTDGGAGRWERDLSTGFTDRPTSIAVDCNDHVYVSGIANYDFIAQIDTATGALNFTHKFPGTDGNYVDVLAVAADSSHFYALGVTEGGLPGASTDQAQNVVATFSSDASFVAADYFGDPTGYEGATMARDSLGRLDVGGETTGSIDGAPEPYAGGFTDAWVAQFSAPSA